MQNGQGDRGALRHVHLAGRAPLNPSRVWIRKRKFTAKTRRAQNRTTVETPAQVHAIQMSLARDRQHHAEDIRCRLSAKGQAENEATNDMERVFVCVNRLSKDAAEFAAACSFVKSSLPPTATFSHKGRAFKQAEAWPAIGALACAELALHKVQAQLAACREQAMKFGTAAGAAERARAKWAHACDTKQRLCPDVQHDENRV